MACACCFCTSVTSGVAVQTVMPWPICAGVLGMARTTAAWAVPSASFLMGTPARIDSSKSCRRRWPRISGST
jgi:hypothetical protein